MKKNLIFVCLIFPFIGYSQLIDTTTTKSKEDVYTIVESMPEFPGGQEAMFKYLASNMNYPAKAKDNYIQGTVFVNFVIGSEGAVRDVKVIRGVNKLLDEESLRVIRSMPNWTPGVQRGKKVAVSYNLPIKFTLHGVDKINCEKKEYTIVDLKPQFKGDIEKLNAQYSVAMAITEKESKTNGILNIQVVIDCNGVPKDFKLIKGLTASIDKRVISKLKEIDEFKNWSAGSHEGAYKNCILNISIELKSGFFLFNNI